MSVEYQAHTALITGGAKGIGRAIVFQLANDGFRVVINYNKSKKEAFEVADILKQKNKKYFLIKADISKESETKKMIGEISKEFGSLDVLANNAGVIKIQPFRALSLNDLDGIFNTNLRGSILVTKLALPLLEKSSNPRIIFISSTSAFIGSNSQFAYSVSKAGIIGAVRSLALELAPRNILVNAVVPGYINTSMINLVKKQMKARIKKIPLGRIGKPEEVAELVSFLASPRNSYITGQCIHINGGRYFG